MKGFLADSRFVNPCSLLVLHVSAKKKRCKGEELEPKGCAFHTEQLSSPLVEVLGHAEVLGLNCKPRTAFKTLGLSLYAHLIPPAKPRCCLDGLALP